jgi:hypothetical protein
MSAESMTLAPAPGAADRTRTAYPTGRNGPGWVSCPGAKTGDSVRVLQGAARSGKVLLDGPDVAGVFYSGVTADGQLYQRSKADLSRHTFIVQLDRGD